MSISAAGPFDGVGVDVIKFHCSSRGRRYIVVFIDYLTKWPDVFATASVTVAELLMEHISRHRVTSELLSHWDTDSLSKLMVDVYIQKWRFTRPISLYTICKQMFYL